MKKTLLAMLLLVLSAAGAVRGQSNFIAIGDTVTAHMYVYNDPENPALGYKPDAPFWLHLDNGLLANDSITKAPILSKAALVTGPASDPYYHIKLSVSDTVSNKRLGMYMTETDADLGLKMDPKLQLTFYAPRIEFTDSAGVVLNAAHPLSGSVNDIIPVKARLVIPEGVTGAGETLKRTWVLDLTLQPALAGLVLLKANPVSNTDTLDGKRLVFVEGAASFCVMAPKAMSSTAGNGVAYVGLPYKFAGVFRLNGSFPAALTISNPDFPDLDKAAIYDTDGDGVGDKIIGWFGSDLDKVGGGDSLDLFSNWPDSGASSALSGTVVKTDGDNTVTITGLKMASQTRYPAAGDFSAEMIARASGQQQTTKTALLDSIGPVIQKATVLKGFNGAPDTLVVLFNKELDSAQVVSHAGDSLFERNGYPIEVDEVQYAGSRTWRFFLDSGLVSAGDSLSIHIDGGIVAADGNKPAYNRPALVSSAGKVPPLASDGNAFYDRDADGRMDSMSVRFATPITAGQLAGIDFRFIWKNTEGFAYELRPEDMTLGDDGLTVGWSIDADSLGVMPFLTSIDSRDYGYAALISTFTINSVDFGDTVLVKMADSMPPVLVSAFLRPESSDEQTPDRLTLVFSEAIDGATLKSRDEYLEFLVDGVPMVFELDNPTWSVDKKTLEVRLAEGIALANRPNPADSVKLHVVMSGGIQDLVGNAVRDNARNVLLEGDPRVLVESVFLVGVDRDYLGEDANGNPRKPVDEVFYPDGTPVAAVEGASLGLLLDIGQSTIPSTTGELDLSKIGMRWELKVYTNAGTYVAGSSNDIRCDDAAFSGNCFENRRKIYLRWNMLADDGRKAGVGVYLTKIIIKVDGQNNNRTIEKIFKWGVKAGSAGRKIR